MQSTRFIFFAVALSVLAVTHMLATTFFLYWTYLWLDIPMHALGGMVVALGFLTVFSAYARGAFQKSVLVTLSVVLGVGVLWEVFELTSAITGPEAGYVQDTIADFVMSLIGGFLGYLCARAGARIDSASST